MILVDEVNNFTETINTIYKGAREFVDSHPLPELPSYEQINNRSCLYESYAAVVEIYNKVTAHLTSVQRLLMTRSVLKKVLSNEVMSPSVKAVVDNAIAEGYEKIGIIDKFVSTYKAGVETQLRFYQSVQYILGSPRLNTMN